jgi:lipopolysaccharide transport system ATP-binding protein
MASISLKNATVEFPVIGPNHQSLRKTIISSALGGIVKHESARRRFIRAINGVSLDAQSGSRIGLLGDNGSGKSTLLRVLSGVYRPTSGEASISGSVATLIDLSLGINPEETGIQNIYLRARMLGIDKKQVSKSLEEIVQFSELGDFIHMPVRTYSAGMQLRLAMSVSTILVPQILIMDEWLAVGDQSFKKKAEIRLNSLVGECEILVIASHSRELLERVCTRGIVLAQGQIVFDGPMLKATEKYFGKEESDER